MLSSSSSSFIKFAKTVRNLGVCLDPTLSSQQQISAVCRICYLELRRISAIRHYLSEDVTKKLLCAFVLSRLDYCNSFLADCPKYLLSKLQKVQNNDARLLSRTTSSALVTPMLHSLQWLPTEQRIEYKLTLLFLIRLPSTFQNFFTFTLLPCSSALLQTPECSEYHPSEHSPTSVSSFKSSLKTFLFLKTCSSVSLP